MIWIFSLNSKIQRLYHIKVREDGYIQKTNPFYVNDRFVFCLSHFKIAEKKIVYRCLKNKLKCQPIKKFYNIDLLGQNLPTHEWGTRGNINMLRNGIKRARFGQDLIVLLCPQSGHAQFGILGA